MPWEAITQIASAIGAIVGTVGTIYTVGRQFGIWRRLRELVQRRRRGRGSRQQR